MPDLDTTVTDYLGQQTPLTLADKAALPVGGPAPGVASAPTGVSGTAASSPTLLTSTATPTGATPAGGAQTVTSTPGGGPALAGAAEPGFQFPDATRASLLSLSPGQRSSLLQKIASLGQAGTKVGSAVEKLFADEPGTGGTFPRDEEGFQAQRTGERQDLGTPAPVPFGVKPELLGTLNEVSPGEITDFGGLFQGTPDIGGPAVSSGELAGAAGGGANILGGGTALGGAAAAGQAFHNIENLLDDRNLTVDQKAIESIFQVGKAVANYYAPVVGGLAADFVHQYIDVPLIESIFGGLGHSKAWQTFPTRVAQTLTGTEGANQGLAVALAKAGSQDEIAAAIMDWKRAVQGAGVGGFGEGSGAFDIPEEPGAGGSRRELGIDADFSPEIAGLRSEVDVARAGGDPSARLGALRDTIRGRLAAMDLKSPAPLTPGESELTPGQASAVSGLTGEAATRDPGLAARELGGAITRAEDTSRGASESGQVAQPAELLAAYQQLTGQPYAAADARARYGEPDVQSGG